MKLSGLLRARNPLHLALGISLGVHAVLLAVRWVDPQAFNRVFQDTPLEVILVNARTQERADKPQALAQAALAGGGDAEQGRASTPLPPAPLTDLGDALHDSQRTLEALQQEQTQLLTQIRQQLATLQEPDRRNPGPSSEQQEQDERRRQLIQLLAEIERRINTENARPKRRYISPATREAVYAVYYDALRRKIEDQGTLNFPQTGGRKLYGELTMIVTVDAAGRVVATEVVQSSGHPQLDRAARSIARQAGPFGPFTADMLRQAEQIVVVARFKFTRDETLETRLTGQ